MSKFTQHTLCDKKIGDFVTIDRVKYLVVAKRNNFLLLEIPDYSLFVGEIGVDVRDNHPIFIERLSNDGRLMVRNFRLVGENLFVKSSICRVLSPSNISLSLSKVPFEYHHGFPFNISFLKSKLKS